MSASVYVVRRSPLSRGPVLFLGGTVMPSEAFADDEVERCERHGCHWRERSACIGNGTFEGRASRVYREKLSR